MIRNSPPRLFGIEAQLFPFPSFCLKFCDNGPRFLIVNALVTGLGIALGAVIFVVCRQPWGVVHGVVMTLLAQVNTIVFKPSLGKSRKGGNIFALTAWLYCGHGIAALLLISSVYRGGVKGVRPIYVPAFFFCMSAVMAFMTCWHKNLISPLDETHPNHICNQRRPFFFMLWNLALAVMSCMIYGCAFARVLSGLVPAPGIWESLIGLGTSVFMVALSYRSYRSSRWGWVLSIVWSTVVCANLVAACVLYRKKPTHFDMKMWYGISFLMCLLYAGCFNLVFVAKFCLLETDEISRLGSRTEQQPKISSSPSTSPSVYNLEARAFGLAQPDVEPQKNQYATGDRSLKRLETDATDVGP